MHSRYSDELDLLDENWIPIGRRKSYALTGEFRQELANGRQG